MNEVIKEESNDYMEKKSIENQGYFCKNFFLFDDKLIWNKIRNVRAYFNNISFDKFDYYSNHFVINSIIISDSWENSQTINLINCLNYYSKKKIVYK